MNKKTGTKLIGCRCTDDTLLRLKGNFAVVYIKMTTRAIYAYVLTVTYVLGQVDL